MSLGKLRGNGEMRNKRHRYTELTKHRWRQWQEMNLTSHSNWGAVKVGSTSRKIHLDFGTDKTENWQRLSLGRVREWMELYRPVGDVQEKGEQGGIKTKLDRKGCERELFSVNQHRLVRSSGWAPHLIITICLIILLTLFLTISLHNLTPYPTCMCAASYWWDLCVSENWWQLLESEQGVQAPLSCGVSCWSEWGLSASD